MATLINVLGPERSGTTLLDVMLGNNDQAFSCGEPVFWFRPMRDHDYTFDCTCGQKDCAIWKTLTRLGEKQFLNYLLNRNKLVIDSSKSLVWTIDNYKHVAKHHNIINIVLWKKPDQLAYSHWKRKEDPNFYHHKALKYYKNLISTGIPFFTLNYDFLISNPQLVLQRISELTGVPSSMNQQEFWKNKNHHVLHGSYGVRTQIIQGKSSIYHEKIQDAQFIKYKNELIKVWEDDLESHQIMSYLNSHDLFLNKDKVNHSMDVRPNKYFWYYKNKFGRKIKKYFPEKFDLDEKK